MSHRLLYIRIGNGCVKGAFITGQPGAAGGEPTARISVFQMTISSTHRGSYNVYANIRKIVAHIKQLLKLENKNRQPEVKVAYFLICGRAKSWLSIDPLE